MKYHYNVDKAYQNMDLSYAILRVSKDGKRLVIDNLKLRAFKRSKDKRKVNDQHK